MPCARHRLCLRWQANRARQLGRVNIDGQAWHVPNQKIDRGAALERKARLLGDQRKNAHEQRDLPAVDVATILKMTPKGQA
jgi:hypothetical protein